MSRIEFETPRQRRAVVCFLLLGFLLGVWFLTWRTFDPDLVVVMFAVSAVAAACDSRREQAASGDPDHLVRTSLWPWWGTSLTYSVAIAGMLLARRFSRDIGAAGVGFLIVLLGVALRVWVENRRVRPRG